VAAVLAIVVLGKSAAALAITKLFKLEKRAGLLVAASLAQIGEFSFILAGVGVSAQLMSRETHDLVLAAALLSIVLNPFAFKLADRLSGPPPGATPAAAAP
jgi:CPA2 family monovalent cation:H+ antiporter-2